ncbi:hypothetical protein ACLMJK_002520 [Lecanora helva]
MALYHDAAPLLVSGEGSENSLKSRVFGCNHLKSQPKQVFALVSEAAKWSPILVEIIEKSGLLHVERKLTPNLALLLVHDLLLAKRGISAPTSHPLRISVEKHKARLSAELTRIRLRKGFASLQDLRADVEAGNSFVEHRGTERADASSDRCSLVEGRRRPRWIRLNTLKTNLSEQLATTFAGFKRVDTLAELSESFPNEDAIYVDEHIPNLVAVSGNNDLVKAAAYSRGQIILQDKASCFPAYLLDPVPEHGSILDACAAPGNKTTHIAAIVNSRGIGNGRSTVYACERDKSRAETLDQMVSRAGASQMVTLKKGHNFLTIDPNQAPWSEVAYLLLDPSCSGSGITSRDEHLRVTLPSRTILESKMQRSKKRKRRSVTQAPTKLVEAQEEIPILTNESPNQLSERLSALSAFQVDLLTHAFCFPSAVKITYSTCSIYTEENEEVVVKALSSEPAKENGWRILPREQQIVGMREWKIRGDPKGCTDASDNIRPEEIAEACIRCAKDDTEGTQGFFVAAFTRDIGPSEACAVQTSLDDEWEGFDDI